MSILILSCGDPEPTCVPGDAAYRFCADEQVWECPMGTPEQIAAKNEVEAMCRMQDDPIQCLFDADQEMVATSLVADCAGGGQICDSDPFANTASCIEP